MANLQASIKDIRKTQKRTQQNLKMKKRFRGAIKKFNSLVTEGNKKAAESYLPRVYKLVDKAAKNGVLKKNNASNQKSKLARTLNNLSAQTNDKPTAKSA